LIGVGYTLALVIGSAVLGVIVVRLQGFAILSRARQSLADGRPPLVPVAEGVLLLLAGILLILPGLIGDAIGLVLLIPPLRRLIAIWSIRQFTREGAARVTVFTTKRWRGGKRQQQPRRPGPVIEGEFTRIDEPRKPRNDRRS
jgi:UPF0716 protein FxsA